MQALLPSIFRTLFTLHNLVLYLLYSIKKWINRNLIYTELGDEKGELSSPETKAEPNKEEERLLFFPGKDCQWKALDSVC